MKAYQFEKYGKDAELKLAEVETPTLDKSDVMVEVHSAGVNVIDVKLMHGDFKAIIPQELPLTLGDDLAGIVTAKGDDVTRFAVGDEVYASPDQKRIGTFAEYIAVNENDVALKPKNITMEEASSLPLVALTAWQVLVERGNLEAGQKVFIQAGSGGVGTIAIQLAKHLGATVATTTGARNIDLVKQLGADIAIDYKTTDFEEVLEDYDLVLHSQDAKTLEKSLRILKAGGKLISISGPPDVEFAKSAGLPLPIQIAVRGLSFKAKKQAKKLGVDYSFLLMRAQGEHLQKIAELVEAGAIKPVIDTVYPFSETPKALAQVEAGRSTGKVVISNK
ncbi:MAG: NADP-dependent oxidoreductase [Candidatus Microsaccharimonas sp.]